MENSDEEPTFIVNSESTFISILSLPSTSTLKDVDQIGNFIFDKMDWDQKGYVDETNFIMYCNLAAVSESRSVWCKIQNAGIGHLSREQWLKFFNAMGTHERTLENAIHKIVAHTLESQDYKALNTSEGYDVTSTLSASSSPHPFSREVAKKRRSSREKCPMYNVGKRMKLSNMRNSKYEGTEVILLKNEGEENWKCYSIEFDENIKIRTRNIVPLHDETSALRTSKDKISTQRMISEESVQDFGRHRKYSNEPMWNARYGDSWTDAISESQLQLAFSPESARVESDEEPTSDSNLYAMNCIRMEIGGDHIQDFEDGDEWVGLNGACAICFAYHPPASIRGHSSSQKSLSKHIHSCSGFHEA